MKNGQLQIRGVSNGFVLSFQGDTLSEEMIAVDAVDCTEKARKLIEDAFAAPETAAESPVRGVRRLIPQPPGRGVRSPELPRAVVMPAEPADGKTE